MCWCNLLRHMYVLRTWCTCIRITQSSSSSTQYVCVCEWVKWPLMTTLFSLFCPLLSSCYVLVHWSCACVCVCAKRERETQRKLRVAKAKWGASKRARKRERASERDRTSQGWKERKKNALQSNGRLFDALPLVVVRALVGDGDDVLFSSSLLALHFSLACSLFAQHATSGLSSHTMLLTLFASAPFFSPCSSFFLSVKRPATTAHNETTIYFPSSS